MLTKATFIYSKNNTIVNLYSLTLKDFSPALTPQQ